VAASDQLPMPFGGNITVRRADQVAATAQLALLTSVG
jgi:hypothetical protein